LGGEGQFGTGHHRKCRPRRPSLPREEVYYSRTSLEFPPNITPTLQQHPCPRYKTTHQFLHLRNELLSSGSTTANDSTVNCATWIPKVLLTLTSLAPSSVTCRLTLCGVTSSLDYVWNTLSDLFMLDLSKSSIRFEMNIGYSTKTNPTRTHRYSQQSSRLGMGLGNVHLTTTTGSSQTITKGVEHSDRTNGETVQAVVLRPRLRESSETYEGRVFRLWGR